MFGFVYLLLCLTQIQANMFAGCGNKWPSTLNFVQNIENIKWVDYYISTATVPSCNYFSGQFNFEDGLYRFIIVYNGPVSIRMNNMEIFHSHGTHKERQTQFKHRLKGSTSISITGDILLFDWKPFTLKIYLYSLPSKFNTDLENDPKCWDSMFAAEPHLFHSLQEDTGTITTNPLEADYFYVPVHSTCKKLVEWIGPDIRFGVEILKNAAIYIKEHFPFWSRHYGKDHIFTHLHDFGPCFAWNERENERKRQDFGIENAIGIVYSGDYSTKCYRHTLDIVVPPYVKDERKAVQTKKDWLAFFQGTVVFKSDWFGIIDVYSRGVRKTLFDLYKNSTTIHIYDKKAPTHKEYVHGFQRSTFALCPLGMASWSPRTIESLIYGSIPVIISDHIVLPFHQELDWTHFSIQVLEKDATTPHKLEEILNNISPERIAQLLHQGKGVISKLLYDNPPWEKHSTYKTLISTLTSRTLQP